MLPQLRRLEHAGAGSDKPVAAVTPLEASPRVVVAGGSVRTPAYRATH